VERIEKKAVNGSGKGEDKKIYNLFALWGINKMKRPLMKSKVNHKKRCFADIC